MLSYNGTDYTLVVITILAVVLLAAAEYFIREFDDAISFEFVEYAPTGDVASAQIVKQLVGLVVRDQN